MVSTHDQPSSAVAVPSGTGTVLVTRRDGMGTITFLLGSLMVLVALSAVFVWMSVEREEPPAEPPAEVATMTVGAKATLATTPDVFHADVYFDFKSTRLRADAVAVLQQHAELVAEGGTWAVVVQGYADHRGPATYNRALAERRGDAVRQFLVELGVPATSIKVVTIGQDGALCDDPGPECQRLNRRVHVEMRRLRLSAAPAVTAPVDEIVER